jgi:DNA-binding MarR family transcriptional regulator
VSVSISALLHHTVTLMDRHAERMLKDEPITFSRFLALACLAESEPCSQHELGQQLGYTDAGISRVATSLRAEGLIDAMPDPSRPQKNVLGLNAKGRQVMEDCADRLENAFREALVEARCDTDRLAQELQGLVKVLAAKETSR